MARASEVVSVIKPPKRVLGSNGEPVAGPPEPKASSEAQKPDSESQTAKDEKDRDRSPCNRKEVLATTDPWEEVDTGGGGNCGYACLEAALTLEKMKNDLQAKAKTVRRDLFKRMSKHATEYKQWFDHG